MQELVYAALVPHPPILVPEVGGGDWERVYTTYLAMQRVAAEVQETAPDTVVVISPHGLVFADAIAFHMVPQLSGNLSAFGAAQVAFSVPVDLDLATRLQSFARRAHVPVAAITEDWARDWEADELDHGVMVPLYFLHQAGWRGAILSVSVGVLRGVEMYAFGQALQQAIRESGRRIAVLASGDLSHRLTLDAPAGYSPEAAEFDRDVVDTLASGDLARLFEMDPSRCEEAGPCAMRPLMMLAGVLDGLEVQPAVHAYEGPLGVGYAVIPLVPGRPDPGRRFRHHLEESERSRLKRRRLAEHPTVALARAALEHYVRTGLELDFSAGAPHEGTVAWRMPPDLPERAGVFVSLKVEGELRGCMGSVEPTEPTLALEIVRTAIMAGFQDPRFLPVEEEELVYLEYTVDLIEAPEPCTVDQLDPEVYGVIVAKGETWGLLLPALPGIHTVPEQLETACRKVGFCPGDSQVTFQRFRARHFL